MPTSPRIHFPFPDENSNPWAAVFEAMVDAIDTSLYAAREDRNLIIMGGGTMSFTAGSGALTWSADIDIFSPITGYLIRIQGPGVATLNDGQICYITLTRNPQTLIIASLQVANVVPHEPRGDDQLLIGLRRGLVVHFRDGFVLGDGENRNVFDSGGGGGGGALVVKDEGTSLGTFTAINFAGSGVTATNAGGGVALVTIPQGAPTIKEEGTPLAGGPHSTLNFIGGIVTAVDAGGGVANISVLGINGVVVKDEGSTVPGGPHTALNFVGPGIVATDAGGGQSNITVTGQVTVQDEGLPIAGGPHSTLNFVGAAVTAVDAGGGVATVTVNVPSLPEAEASLVAGVFSTINALFTRAGSRLIDVLYWPATIGPLTRSIYFKADIECSTFATTANVRLQNITDNETVTGTALNTGLQVNTEVTSAALTVGVAAGNLKSGTPKQYEVQVSLTGGGAGDTVTITNARLCVRYA